MYIIGGVKMAETIALISRKGGSGKTTTAQVMSAGFTSKGAKVLCIDLDGQASLTHIMGADTNGNSIIDVFNDKKNITDAIQHTPTGDIIAANTELDLADMRLTGQGRELLLKRALESVKRDYDLILLDTVGAFGVLTLNALAVADGVILPAQADILSLNALKDSYDLIQSARDNVNAGLKIYGVLLTRFNARANITRDLLAMFEQAAQVMNTRVFNAKIRESVAVKEAQAMQTDLLKHKPQNKAAQDYSAFIAELDSIIKTEAKV